jgi:hypothetical protein
VCKFWNSVAIAVDPVPSTETRIAATDRESCFVSEYGRRTRECDQELRP